MGGGEDRHPACQVLNYSVERWPFVKAVEAMLGVAPQERLERLHARLEGSLPVATQEKDQATPFHRRFYDGQRHPVFRHLYERFVREVAAPFLGLAEGAYLYQRIPTFRVHLPGNLAVGEFHRDLEYGHQAEEVNVWVPLTGARDTATVWIESAPGAGDYAPAEASPGEALVFSGATLQHGNRINKTGETRVSFDFRLLAREALREDGRLSINARMPFEVGPEGYWLQA